MAAPSEAALASAWSSVNPGPGDEQMDIVSRIPRSVSDIDNIVSAEHVARREYHQHASPIASSSTTAEYSRLNIDIPLDPYSDFSMKLTQEDGKVQEIVTRFESLSVRDGSNRLVSDDIPVRADQARARSLSDTTAVQAESDTETEPVRELRGHHGTADTSERQDTFSSPFSIGHPDLGPAVELSPTSRTKHGSTISKTTSKKALRLAESTSGEIGDAEPTSPRRKPIPRGWGPSLATEQRAKQRSERKKMTQEDTTSTISRKSVRTARVSIDGGKAHAHDSTSFLTKEAIESVESDLTGPHRHTNSSRLRQSASKASIKSPSGSSPLRGSPGNNSTIQITVSPSRSHRSSIPNLDGTSYSGPADRLADSRRHSRAPSTISSVGGFVTARQSPVSPESARYHSAAGEVEEDDVPVLELANPCETAQGTKDSSKPHTRGKSEPHVKVSPATRPSAPALSLRIPHYHSSTCSTDRKLHSAGSAPSSASGTPSSPTHSSRIPRVHSAKEEQERATGSLRRTKSAKALQTKPATGVGEGEGHETCAKDQPTLPQRPAHIRALPCNDAVTKPSEGMYAVDTAEACAIPLPATPAPAMFRHVRTLDDQGSTPILTSVSSKRVAKADFLAITDDSHTKEPAPTPSSTNISPAQAPPAVTSIETYIATKIPMEPPETKSDAATGDPSTSLSETSIGLHPVVIAASLHPDKQEMEQTSSISDNTTIQETSEKDDPILHDSAIIYSRRKSDVTGMPFLLPIKNTPLICMIAHEVRYTGSGYMNQTPGQASVIPSSSASMTDTTAVDNSTSRTENETTTNVPEEASTAGRPAPSLRADAAEFIPGTPNPQAPNPQERVLTEEEWAQILPPFNPYDLDPYGQPLYHLMYPVAVGPGTTLDFSAYRPYHTSPKRGKKKQWSPKRNRQSRSDNNMTGSPMKTQRGEGDKQGDESSHSEQVKVDRKGKGKAKDSATALAASAGISPEELEALRAANAREDSKATPDKAAFAGQMEAMTKQAATFRLSQGPSGRGPRPMSWASMSQQPSETETVPEARVQHEESSFDTVQAMPSNIVSSALGTASHEMPRNMSYAHNSLPLPAHGRQQYMPTFPRQQHHQNHPRNPMYPFGPASSSHENTRPERYNRRNRNWAPPAGVPLDENDFPNPVAPPGPRPAEPELQVQKSKDYVGYSTVDNEPKCGEMNIVEACEWLGVCGDCASKQHGQH